MAFFELILLITNMNIKIVKNKYINAVLLMMILSATVHISILFAIALVSGDLYVLNYFNTISLTYFYPDFLNSFLGNIIAFVFMVCMYVIILVCNKIE